MWVYSYLKKITVYVCVLLQTDVWGLENSPKNYRSMAFEYSVRLVGYKIALVGTQNEKRLQRVPSQINVCEDVCVPL